MTRNLLLSKDPDLKTNNLLKGLPPGEALYSVVNLQCPDKKVPPQGQDFKNVFIFQDQNLMTSGGAVKDENVAVASSK